MSTESGVQHLSEISTVWTEFGRAHADSAAARERFLRRYLGAVKRYLLAAVRDAHAAEDLTQDFALRFLEGRFRHANPARGRFRDYVKTALFHLVDDYQKRQAKAGPQVPLSGHEPQAAAEDCEQAFRDSWRQQLLDQAWDALAAVQKNGGPPYCEALRLRKEHPKLSSAELAQRLGERVGRTFTSASYRQELHRARDKFTELLREEVGRTLRDKAPDRIDEELCELNLLEYCRPAGKRRFGG